MDEGENMEERGGTVQGTTVFAPISHPILKSVDPVKVSQFLRARERYENEISENKKENSSLSKASYKISVDSGLLKRMHFLGELEPFAPGKEFSQLTSTHIEKWVKSLVQQEEDTFDPSVVERAITGVKVNMQIANPRARTLEYCSDFFARLEEVGYDSFKEKNPKMTVKLLQRHLFPKNFKDAMRKTMDYQESLESDVKGYVEVLCQEAINYEKYMVLGKQNQGSSSRDVVEDKNVGASSKGKSKHITNTPKNSSKKNSDSKGAPLCLNPKCAEEGLRHWVSTGCDRTSAEEAKRLIEEKKKSRKGQGAKKVGRNGHEKHLNSCLMNAMFAKTVERILCVDGGSDINLMPQDLFEDLKKKDATMKVTYYNSPRKYNLALEEDPKGQGIYIEVNKEVVLNVELFARHGSYLELRKLKWYVATGKVSDPLLGRPVLESLGINTKELIMAAADKIGSSVDMEVLMGHQDYPEGCVARLLQRGVYHADRGWQNETFEGDDEEWLELGHDTPQQIDEAIDSAVKEAVKSGISQGGKQELERMLHDYRDVLRIRLGKDPPAKVEPMKVELIEGAKPLRAKPRRYTVDGRKFMEGYTDRVLEFGFGKLNQNAKWAAAPVLVAKPPPAIFRLTFDYVPVNHYTIPVSWPMPHLDSELADLAGSKFFATIHFVSGYWQLPLEEESQEKLSFMTSNRIVQPTRCTQGAKNAAANFQAKVEPLFSHMRESLKAWLEDFMLHHKHEQGLLEKLRQFLEVCRDFNLKIGITKCHLFLLVGRWCGRVIDGKGVQLDPRNLSGLKDIHTPINAGELCEYVHCLQWMSNGIPDFQDRIAPMRALLEEAYKRSGSRKKKFIQKITLSRLGWGEEHGHLFKEFQEQLKNMTKLSHRDETKDICVYTDASDAYWAGVVTQCEKGELEKDIENQKHEPLAFLGKAFSGHEERWTTYEKESYAIYLTFEKMDYLLLTEEKVHVFTDHRNLLFAFNPVALNPSLGRHVITKVQRWGLFLSRFAYVIEHIEGEKNIMADIMTRWWRGYRGKRLAVKRITHVLLEKDMVESPMEKGFVWPSMQMIKKSQAKNLGCLDNGAHIDADGLYRWDGKISVPRDDSALQVKLLVVANCGKSGHRGQEATGSILKETYRWKNMDEDIAEFVNMCLHCKTGKTGHRIPRPLSTTLHGTKPNEVIHFDFLYMGMGIEGYKYILVLRDDLSSYLWLCLAKKATAEVAAECLARWIRTFSVMKMWVSDQGSHFKNEIMSNLAKDYKVQHSFAVAYSPWVNGTVESCMKHVQAAYRCLQSELKLGPQDWPSMVGMIQTILNEAPLRCLGAKEDGTFRTPLEVVTGIKPKREVIKSAALGETTLKTHSRDKVRAMQVIEIETLQSAFDSMHKAVSAKVMANRQRQIKSHNMKTNLVCPNFGVGDFALVRRAQDKGHKQSHRWIGPRRITKVCSQFVYEVESILTGKTEKVHAARLLKYRANKDGEEVSQELMAHIEKSESSYEVKDQLMDMAGDKEAGFDIQVKWLGLPEKKDWTWQPIKELHEDIPEEVEAFLKKSKKNKIAKEAAKEIGLRI